jgi:hypothetical protein
LREGHETPPWDMPDDHQLIGMVPPDRSRLVPGRKARLEKRQPDGPAPSARRTRMDGSSL